jgi:hypothetical protein
MHELSAGKRWSLYIAQPGLGQGAYVGMQGHCNVASFFGSVFSAVDKELCLKRNCPSFDGLSCWCKAIVTILLIRSPEQAVAGSLWEAKAVLLNLAHAASSQTVRMTIN